MKGKRKKKIIFSIFFTAIIFVATIAYIGVRADGLNTYNANEWEEFKGRTKEEIAEKYSEAIKAGPTYVDRDSSTYYIVEPSLEGTGTGGQLTEDTHIAMTEMSNYYRWLAGVTPLAKTSEHNDGLQAGAYIRPNSNFGHNLSGVTKPDNIPQELWDAGKVAHNILSWNSTPRGSITNWINEGQYLFDSSLSTVGHRHAIISPTTYSINFGYAGATGIGKVVMRMEEPRTPFTAYPAPGYMPTNAISLIESAWSIEPDRHVMKYDSIDDVTVTVKNLNTNESYECTTANGGLIEDGNTLSPVLVFSHPDLDSFSYQDKDKFQVDVTGFKNVTTGEDIALTYTVEFFDIKDYIESTVESVTLEDYDEIVITKKVNTQETLQTISKMLPSNVKVTADSGKTLTISTLSDWKVDENKKCFYVAGDASELPSNIKDSENKLARIEIPYSVDDGIGTLSFNDSYPVIGQSGRFEMGVLSTKPSTEFTYELYQVVDGTPTLRFDENDEQTTTGVYRVFFNFDSLTKDDEGTYIGIYYDDSTAYVTGTSDLEIAEKEVTSVKILNVHKNAYKIGDDLEIDGEEVVITYADGSSETVPMTKDMLSYPSFTRNSIYIIKASIQGVEDQFSVLVTGAPDSLNATYGQTLGDLSIPNSAYGKYSFNDDLSTPVGDVGTNKFKVTFTPNDSTYSKITDFEIEINVKQQTPDMDAITVEATYGDTLADITLPTHENGTYEFEQLLTESVGNAGTNEGNFTVTFTPNDDNYTKVENIPVIIKVNKATPKYEIPNNLEAGFNDTLKDVALPVGFTWQNPEESVGNVGTNYHLVTYTPTDTANYEIVKDIKIPVEVGAATPEYEVPSNLTATYGQTLADVTLPATENGTYKFVLDNKTSVGEVGENQFEVTYTPNDNNYRTVTFEVTIKVEKANPTYEVPSGLKAFYNQTLKDVVLPTTENGKFTWVDDSTKVGDAGVQTHYVNFTPNDTDNYNTIENIEVTINVEKANPEYTEPSNLTAKYNDILKDVLLPEGWTWKDETKEVGEVGTNTHIAIFTPSDTNNYKKVEVEVEIKVEKANPSITELEDLTATYGDTLGDISLPTSSNGNYEWEDLLTTSVGDAGTHTFTVTFIPSDEKNYEKVTGIEVTVIVKKKKIDSITLPTLNEVVYDENTTLASIDLPSGWRWDNPNTVPSVDNNGYKATYTPADTNNYDYTGLDLNPTLTLKVTQKTPTFTKPVVVANAGQLLEEVKLPELSNGKFVWNNGKESVGEVGTHTFTATFIPNDTTNYKTVSDVEVTVEVGKALPEFEIPSNLTATYQDTLESVKLPEGWTWDNEKQVLSSVGTHTYTATYTPADTDNFAIVTNIEIMVQVNKKKGETITIPTLQEITYDENLTLGNISLPEGWTWDDPSIVPTVDNNGYKATYTPEDTINYDYSDQNLNPTLTLKVNKKDPIIENPSKITVPYGTNLEDIKLPDGFYLEEVGKLNEIGTFTYKAIYRPSNPNYNSVDDIEITIEVEKANPSVATPNDIILEKEDNLVLANIPLPNGWKWKNPDEAVTKTGYYEAIYTPDDETHYNTITREVYIEFVENESIPVTQDKIESPETGDNIINYIILLITSLIGLTGIGYHLKHKN